MAHPLGPPLPAATVMNEFIPVVLLQNSTGVVLAPPTVVAISALAQELFQGISGIYDRADSYVGELVELGPAHRYVIRSRRHTADSDSIRGII